MSDPKNRLIHIINMLKINNVIMGNTVYQLIQSINLN